MKRYYITYKTGITIEIKESIFKTIQKQLNENEYKLKIELSKDEEFYRIILI